MGKLTKSKEKPTIKSPTDKLLSIPGVKEAIWTVRRHARDCAWDDAWIHEIFKLKYTKLEDIKVDDIKVDGDTEDEWLEDLALKAGPKIAELWELSEGAGDRLADVIYWGRSDRPTEPSYFLPFVLVIKAKQGAARDVAQKLSQCEREFEHIDALVTSSKNIRPNHIYLDVTYLSYSALRRAYKAIALCRQCLAIETRDLREGAPEAINTERALKCVELAKTGKSSKQIARELGFRVYSSVNPSGTYPLFRKYLKRGQEIQQKLQALDKYLGEVEMQVLETK